MPVSTRTRQRPPDGRSRFALACGDTLPQARMHEKLTRYSGRAGLCAAVSALYRPSMYEPIHTTPERACVRLRDVGAAWMLVALLLLAGVLPGTLQVAKAEAIHAACATRCEFVTVLQAVPKLLQRSHPA